MSGAYTDDDLRRIETTLGAKARREAVARFDLRQRHLDEWAMTVSGAVEEAVSENTGKSDTPPPFDGVERGSGSPESPHFCRLCPQTRQGGERSMGQQPHADPYNAPGISSRLGG